MKKYRLEAKSIGSLFVLLSAAGCLAWMGNQSAFGGSIYEAPLIAQNSITLNGNVVVDSYNSRDTNYSTGGLYDAAKRKDGGNIVLRSYFGGIVTLGGSVDIYGRAYLGNTGTISMIAGAVLGSTAWINGGAVGIEPGWVIQFAQNFPDLPYTPLPPTNSLYTLPAKTSNTLDGTNYANSYLLTTGNYEQASNFTMMSSDKILVSGKVNLHFLGSISMAGSSQIIIGTNSSLTIHLFTDATFGGLGILNNSKNSTNCTIWGDYDWTGGRVFSVSLAGTSPFYGNIYVPTAAFLASGGGASVFNIHGAVIANSIRFAGKVESHFDEAYPIWPLLFGTGSRVGAAIIPPFNRKLVYVEGMFGYTYALESSTNLSDWSRVMTNTSPFTFTNIPTDVPQQFYRAVYLP